MTEKKSGTRKVPGKIKTTRRKIIIIDLEFGTQGHILVTEILLQIII